MEAWLALWEPDLGRPTRDAGVRGPQWASLAKQGEGMDCGSSQLLSS